MVMAQMSVINATPVDWSVVLFIMVATVGVFAKWVWPAIVMMSKGGAAYRASGETNGAAAKALEQRTEILGRLQAHEPMFEGLVSSQQRIAEEQGRLAAVLNETHKLVLLMEQRGRGQDEAIKIVVEEARVNAAVDAKLRDMGITPAARRRK